MNTGRIRVTFAYKTKINEKHDSFPPNHESNQYLCGIPSSGYGVLYYKKILMSQFKRDFCFKWHVIYFTGELIFLYSHRGIWIGYENIPNEYLINYLVVLSSSFYLFKSHPWTLYFAFLFVCVSWYTMRT